MNKLLVKLMMMAGILVCTLVPLSYLLDHFFSTSFRSEKDFWVLNQKNGEYDFAVIGSSRVHNNVDVNEMERYLGGNGINMGVPGTNYAGMLLVLNRFINNGNRIKLLLLQVDVSGFDSVNWFSNPFPVHIYLPMINTDNDVDRIIKENTTSRNYIMWKYLPFAKYIEFNTEYVKYISRYFRKQFEADLTLNKGTNLLPPVEMNDFRFTNKGKTIDMKDYSDLTKIIDYCNRHGIKPILFTAPLYYEFNKKIAFVDTYNDVLSHLSEEYRVRYVQIEDGPIVTDKKYFVDYTHTNEVGSRLFSRMFAEKLKNYSN